MNNIAISTETHYLEEESNPARQRFAFSYTITISNHSPHAVQLLGRHWIITDSDEHVEEVEGEGVVGLRPIIEAGESFSYTSGAMIRTELGTMHGSYHFVDALGNPFSVNIPVFRLAVAMQLH